MNSLLVVGIATILLLVAVTVTATVNAQSQTAKACVSQELKNAIAYASLLQSTGRTNDINQTFYDIGTNVIMKCVGK